MDEAWTNWSGSQQHRPRAIVAVTDESGVVEAVRNAARAGWTVRAVGSAHSFVPFWTDGMVLTTDGLAGILDVDVDVDGARRTARIAAGTKLHALGPLLWAHGLSLPQQGDIDRQSVAGALATGTHGTGRSLPNLSAWVRAISVIDAAGERHEWTREAAPGPLAAARVAMGMLGVVVDVTLDLEPAFHLHERIEQVPFAAIADGVEARIAAHRHFEFFWTPRSDACELKTLDRVPGAATGDGLPSGERIAPAWQVFPSERAVKFNEMEFSVPYARGWECFLELRALLRRDFPRLPWPIEYRTLAADDAWLSSAYGRESVTLSVHQGAERDFAPLFSASEAIFRNHGGRPHWGKWHGWSARDLADSHPRSGDFARLRAQLDPGGRFLNPWLRGLLAT